MGVEYSDSGLATLVATPLSAATRVGLGLLSLLAGADSFGSLLVDLPLEPTDEAPLGLVLGGKDRSLGLNVMSFIQTGVKNAVAPDFVSLKEPLLLWDLLVDRLRSLAFFLSSSLCLACVSNLIWDSSNPWSRLFVGSPHTSLVRTDPSYCLVPGCLLGRLAFDPAGRLAGLGLSSGSTAGPAGGAAEDRLPAPIDNFFWMDFTPPVIFDNLDFFLNSTSGSSAVGGGCLFSAGGGGLDPLFPGFLASLRGETDLMAFLWEFWAGIFPPALGIAPVVSHAGSSRVGGGPAGGKGSTC